MTPGASPDHGDSPGASARPPPPHCSRRYCPACCRGRCCVSPEMKNHHWTMLVMWHEYCVIIGQEGKMIIFRKFASNHQSRNILRKFVAVQLCDIYKLSFYWLIEKMLSTLICFIIKRWNSFLVLLRVFGSIHKSSRVQACEEGEGYFSTFLYIFWQLYLTQHIWSGELSLKGLIVWSHQK